MANMPTPEPRAMSGPSGPSTAPNANEAMAASATLGRNATAVGARLIPVSGSWPPSPGSKVRAAHTSRPPTAGSPRTSHHGAVVYPIAAGRVCQSQCSMTCTASRKTRATTAAGTPMAAPIAMSRR